MYKKLKRKNVLRLLSMILVVASLSGSPALAKEIKNINSVNKSVNKVVLEDDNNKKEPVTYISVVENQKKKIDSYIASYDKKGYFNGENLSIRKRNKRMVARYKNATIIKNSILTESGSYMNNYMESRQIPNYIQNISFAASIGVLENLDLDEDILEGLKIHISPHPYRNSSGFAVQHIKEISIHEMDLIGPDIAKYMELSSLVSHELWHAIEPFLIKDYKARYGTDLIDDYANYYEKFSNKKYKTLLKGEYDRQNDIYEAIATDFAIYQGMRIRRLVNDMNTSHSPTNKDSLLKYNHGVTDFFDKVLYDR